MIHAFVVYCLVLNPYMCRQWELAPVDHKIVSTADCMKGVMMGGSVFSYEGLAWFVKGGGCKGNGPSADEVSTYLRERVQP